MIKPNDFALCIKHNCILREKCDRYYPLPIGMHQSMVIPKESGKDCKLFINKPKNKKQ